jgi:hypothetical protein
MPPRTDIFSTIIGAGLGRSKKKLDSRFRGNDDEG